ncbi:hypothetical protein [Nakamurella multipartita]|uniref:Uncharacterized protein n=1 Tax=Nakamurella multipartita (strain ATCC 700099 / DSM 44233 / CIP 104796 / JCM 9543 / NBRC 105858 / Y-104) TaxID=479431 RepID=C8X8L9_NAKMY|nr:hypothetical protein [Nakamurella multipartita]ACV79074.1 hypothetical protein Namu_2728 [Nakamurella multipartita DSM 44233]
MGITIGLEMPDQPLSWTVVHRDDDSPWRGGFADAAAAESAARRHDRVCHHEDCVVYGSRVVAVFEPEFDAAPSVQISASNARHLADVLGLGTDIWEVPALDPDALMGRVLLAQAISPVDVGVPPAVAGQVIDCGRRAGWTEHRLAQVHQVAMAARRLGVRVIWS